MRMGRLVRGALALGAVAFAVGVQAGMPTFADAAPPAVAATPVSHHCHHHSWGHHCSDDDPTTTPPTTTSTTTTTTSGPVLTIDTETPDPTDTDDPTSSDPSSSATTSSTESTDDDNGPVIVPTRPSTSGRPTSPGVTHTLTTDRTVKPRPTTKRSDSGIVAPGSNNNPRNPPSRHVPNRSVPSVGSSPLPGNPADKTAPGDRDRSTVAEPASPADIPGTVTALPSPSSATASQYVAAAAGVGGVAAVAVGAGAMSFRSARAGRVRVNTARAEFLSPRI